MERLVAVKSESDILPAFRKTPIETLLAYQEPESTARRP